MIGQTISHYRIVSQLGVGGMGVVYAAEDSRLGRNVALKFVPEDLARDPQAVERLKIEARTASGLNHANICTIYDIDEHDGRPFIAMELLHGQTLRDRLAASGPLKIHEILTLGIQVADALDSAHRRNVIHRDIKPANLFLIDRGQVKILDFGLAKTLSPHKASSTLAATTDLTGHGVTLGTVSYMSPEQVTGEPLDPRTDLFSFGVVLYESATGHQPFPGKTSALVFTAILNRAPVAPVVLNPEMPLRLQDIINNCLEKDRELRYQDAAGLRADLMRLKRDLESGHSGVMRIAGTGLPSTVAPTTAGRTTTAREAVAPPRVTAPDTPRPSTAGRTGGLAFPIAAIAVVVAMVGAVSYLSWLRNAGVPERTVGRAPTEVESRNLLQLAESSLRSKDYRAAVSHAEEALRTSPNQGDAIRIRNDARAMLAKFDEAIARTRSLLAAGDIDSAAMALEAARDIEPSAPAIGELSAQVVNAYKIQAEATRRARQGAAVPAPLPPPARSPARESGRAAVPPRQSVDDVPSVSPPTPTPAPAPAAQVPPPAPPAAPSNAAPPAAPVPESPPRPTQLPPAATEAPPVARGESSGSKEPPLEEDEAAIRRVVATYGRAIETKNLALFRSVKPNLSAEEQRRIEDGFRAVTSQKVEITILEIERRGQEASVRLKRRDTIRVSSREQISESQQTMTLTRTGSGWVIHEIGR